MEHWPGRETADIVYNDQKGAFTDLLIQEGFLDGDIWSGATPEYFIEVKTTTGECNDRFFMSNSQVERVRLFHFLLFDLQSLIKPNR